MDRKLLAIYLNDHLAGSVVGANLAKRIARENGLEELRRGSLAGRGERLVPRRRLGPLPKRRNSRALPGGRGEGAGGPRRVPS